MAQAYNPQYPKNFLSESLTFVGCILTAMAVGSGLYLTGTGIYMALSQPGSPWVQTTLIGAGLFLAGIAIYFIFRLLAKWAAIFWQKITGKRQ